MKGKYKEAIDLFSKIQNENQKDSKVNYNLACAYYRDGQFDKAIEHFKHIKEKIKLQDIKNDF